jgi:hypothetical protein
VKFAALDPYDPLYALDLERLGEQFPDALIQDNVEVHLALHAPRHENVLGQLRQIIGKYPDGDGNVEALYELGCLEMQFALPRASAEYTERRESAIRAFKQLRELAPESVYSTLAGNRLKLLGVEKRADEPVTAEDAAPAQ